MTSFPACSAGYRIRTRPLCAPGAIGMNDNLRFHQSAALPLPILGSGTLAARTFERSGPNSVGALALAARFISQGTRLILNFCRTILAAGKPSFGSLIQDPEKSLSVRNILCCPKPLSLLAADHGSNHAARSVGNVRKVVGEIQNVEC